MDFFLNRMAEELKLIGSSQRTIRAYGYCLRGYLLFLRERHHEDCEFLDVEKIRSFLLSKQDEGLAPQTVNLYLNAIKFFYRRVLRNGAPIDLRFAKRTRRLPMVLSKEEILKILEVIRNGKHRLLVALAYGAGLRVSEVVNLKVKDVDFEHHLLWIRKGKGGKDRVTLLPQKLNQEIQFFMTRKKLDDFLFESQRGGKMHTRTAQKVFAGALRKAGISKKVTFHALRHSFATHLLEQGTHIRYLQELLGHNNIQTTQIYTKVTNVALARIKSPL